MNTIEIGSYTFTDSDLISGNIVMEHSAIGETLSADALTFRVLCTDTGNKALFTKFLEWYHTVDNKGFVIEGDNIEDLTYATPAYYYIDGVLQNKFFLSKIKRVGAEVYQLECLSAVGLLITSKHYGGIYNGISASTLIADILDGITYTLDATLANAVIRGYLPIETKRDALQQVLFAIQGAVKVESDGTLSIVSMSNQGTGSIGADRVYLMNGQTERSEKVDGVQLTEHNYFVGGDNETLFDDSITGVQLITFSEPHYNIAAVNGGGTNILVSSGANYAVVGSAGVSQACTITGNKYIHVERVVSAGNVAVTGDENIMQVPNAYLANPEIADDLVDIVWNYAQCDQKIRADIIVGGEKPGDVVSIVNPYSYQSVQAMMLSMNITMSKTNKATAEFLIDYTPASVVTGFKHYVLLTGDGTWSSNGSDITITPTSGKIIIDGTEYTTAQTLHDDEYDIDKIRFILVGGGSGGGLGTAGGAGGQASLTKHEERTYNSSGTNYYDRVDYYGPGTGGNGGQGGKGGNCGRIFELSRDVANGDSGTYSCGSGGNAGATPSETPSGSESTFAQNTATFTSASGRYYKTGYVEVKSGLTLAGSGTDGVDGGNGGSGAPNISNNTTGLKGDDVEGYSGGNATAAYNNSWQVGEGAQKAYLGYTIYGMGGGGASALANGGNAQASASQRAVVMQPGNGANGGSAPATTRYGQGGDGGNGGGGGGGGSIYNTSYGLTNTTSRYYETPVSTGGSGGSGAAGHQGCIFLYF